MKKEKMYVERKSVYVRDRNYSEVVMLKRFGDFGDSLIGYYETYDGVNFDYVVFEAFRSDDVYDLEFYQPIVVSKGVYEFPPLYKGQTVTDELAVAFTKLLIDREEQVSCGDHIDEMKLHKELEFYINFAAFVELDNPCLSDFENISYLIPEGVEDANDDEYEVAKHIEQPLIDKIFKLYEGVLK